MKLAPPHVLLGLACLSSPEICVAQQQAAAATVVAEVEGRAITLGQVGDVIRGMPRANRAQPFDTLYSIALLQLTEIQALVIRAQRQGLDDQPALRERARLAHDNAVADAELTAEANARVTEAMVLDRYKRDYAEKPGPEEVDVSIIVVGTQGAANAVLAELAGGASFADLARRESRDSSASAGGSLGFVRRQVLTPEVAAVAFTLAPGQTTARPLQSGDNWLIVRAGNHRAGPVPTFADVQARIRDDLMRESFPDLGKAAMDGLIVRTFAITGKDSAVVPALQP